MNIINQSKHKKYIVPTNDWLVPLSKLNSNDINTKSTIMVGNHIEKNKVIVKITRNISFDDVQYIDNYINGLPNFPEIYGIFECYETEDNIRTFYENIKGFCNKSKDDCSNVKIVIEIMKRYKNSLHNYERRIKIDRFENYLKQCILAQLNAFNLVGFLHNDIHLGNILVERVIEKPVELVYTILDKKYIVNTNDMIIITDFDASIIVNKNIPFCEKNTLFSNIVKTFRDFSQLIEIDKSIKLLQILDEIIFDNKRRYHDWESSRLNSVIHYGVRMEDYKEDVLLYTMEMIDRIWIKMFGKILMGRNGSMEKEKNENKNIFEELTTIKQENKKLKKIIKSILPFVDNIYENSMNIKKIIV